MLHIVLPDIKRAGIVGQVFSLRLLNRVGIPISCRLDFPRVSLSAVRIVIIPSITCVCTSLYYWSLYWPSSPPRRPLRCQCRQKNQLAIVITVRGTVTDQYIQISFETIQLSGCDSLPGEKSKNVMLNNAYCIQYLYFQCCPQNVPRQMLQVGM